jgi:hypothetical protein
LIVHDDQGGPYLRLMRPTKVKRVGPEPANRVTDYNTEDIHALIVPLPERVFLYAEKAEELARAWIDTSAELWKRIVETKNRIGEANPFGSKGDGLASFSSSELITRTFLVRGYSHYRWLAESGADATILGLAAMLHLPRFIWITEFYRRVNAGAQEFDRVVAHVVSDATAANATTRHDTFLFGHRPQFAAALLTGRRRDDRILSTLLKSERGYASYRIWKQRHASSD